MRKWIEQLIQDCVAREIAKWKVENDNHYIILRNDIARYHSDLRTFIQNRPATATIKPADEEQERELRKKQFQRRMGLSDAQAAEVDWDKVLG